MLFTVDGTYSCELLQAKPAERARPPGSPLAPPLSPAAMARSSAVAQGPVPGAVLPPRAPGGFRYRATPCWVPPTFRSVLPVFFLAAPSGMQGPRPTIDLMPSALEMQRLNHQTTVEVLSPALFALQIPLISKVGVGRQLSGSCRPRRGFCNTVLHNLDQNIIRPVLKSSLNSCSP